MSFDLTKALEKKLVDSALKELDTEAVKKEVATAVEAYFKSEIFHDMIAEALSEDGVGWDLGVAIGRQISKSMKGMKVTLG
jgi:hypothetical protein